MRIAFLTTDNREHYKDYANPKPWFGSAPEAVLQGFAKMPGVEVHVISCTREVTTSPKKLADNIFFHGLYVPKWGWIRTGYQGCIRATRAKLREIKPDIVHGQGSERDCAISAVLSGLPNVVTIHGNMVNVARVLHSRVGSYIWLSARLETFALKRTLGVFCNSEHTELVVRPRARRVWRVPNPVREIFFRPRQCPAVASGCRVLNLGVVSSHKRQVELLDALSRLPRNDNDFELVFCGYAHPSSDYANALLEKIKSLPGWVRYVGLKSADELVDLMDSSHALVHVPLEESFGLVVAESLCRGLKLFGFGVGGVRDIAAGVPGAELVPNNDWPGLSSAVAAWVARGFPRSPEAGELMKARYYPDVIAHRHLEIYREVLSKTS